MKIAKRLTNIAVGTYIDHKGDLIVITSAYDAIMAGTSITTRTLTTAEM